VIRGLITPETTPPSIPTTFRTAPAILLFRYSGFNSYRAEIALFGASSRFPTDGQSFREKSRTTSGRTGYGQNHHSRKRAWQRAHGCAKTIQVYYCKNYSMPPQSIRPSEPRTSEVGRRPKISTRPTPFPETRPTTIEGWTVRDVVGATAVLEGPDGLWRATSGDQVPGVGRVESIVRWGGRWIVATNMGLISSP
jgi:hypothetical protein